MDTSELLTRAKAVRMSAERSVAMRQALVGDERREMHLAATWHLRRAAVPGSVDNLVYGHGSNEQALGALDICPVAMLGLKAAGALAYPWLVEAAEADPAGTYVDHARAVLAHSGRRAYCVALGAYHRFQWKRAVYERTVGDWQAKPVAQDPAAPWRRRPVTARQQRLVETVVECLSAVDPSFIPFAPASRGEAHDWLLAAGGRPLFWHAPELPTFTECGA